MSTPTTFDAHIPGDPMPCPADALVIARLSNGYEGDVRKGADYAWGKLDHPYYEIASWRFADVAPPQEKDEPPADWRKDSSLETWFPLTAQELTRLREENASMRTAIKEAYEFLTSERWPQWGDDLRWRQFNLEQEAVKLQPFTESK